MIRYKASKNQIKFYKLERLKKEGFLNIALLYNIKKEIELKDLVKYIIEINEVFRTYILFEDNTYYQIIKETDNVNIINSYIYTSSLDIIEELNKYKFQLDYKEKENEALIKFSIIKVLDNTYLHILCPHICFDIYSEIVLLNQIKNYYKGIYEICNLNYIKYTNDEFIELNNKENEQWWMNYIGENRSWLNYLPIDGKPVFLNEKNKLSYDKLSIEKIKLYCNKKRLLLFPFILSIFQLYIYKVFNINTTTIRVPIYNRDKEYVKKTVGSFFNLLYVIRNVKNKDNTKDLLEIYKENIKDIMELNSRSVYSCDEIKKFFIKEVLNNQYVLSVLDNTGLVDRILINNIEWESIYVEEELQSDIYIEIWKDNIYFKYNSMFFNKDNLSLKVLEDIINDLN
jgi:hypothetical protein